MLPNSANKLIEEFSKLPGIGPKSASRLVFYLLGKSKEDVINFGQAVIDLKQGLRECRGCFNISERGLCKICRSAKRDRRQLMVVEQPLDVVAMEKTEYQGLYHVLGGVISPIDGVGPEHLRIEQLIDRLKKGSFKEMILATDPSLEGEATAMYIGKLVAKDEELKTKGIKVTRIARGLPVGGDLEYADEDTLNQAIEGRLEY
jgi:recombination protein RecR